MTAGELKELLKEIPDDSYVVFKPQNSSYVEDFSLYTKERNISSFWGSDFKAVVIKSDGQCGAL